MEDLLKAPTPIGGRFMVESIKRLEHEATSSLTKSMSRLDRRFITPLDREDIHVLASAAR